MFYSLFGAFKLLGRIHLKLVKVAEFLSHNISFKKQFNIKNLKLFLKGFKKTV